MFFFEALAQLREHAPDFRAAGVRLGVVVQAAAEDLNETCGYSPDLTCIPDPDKTTHHALGLERMTGWKLLTSAPLRQRRKEAGRAGFAQKWGKTFSSQSDWRLVPGAALVARGGRILWLHRGSHVGDLPAADDLLAVTQEFILPSHSERRG